MEKRVARRKMLRRKYKHYVAALAGAAIMAGATWHGTPITKASAAENATTPSPVIVGQGPLVAEDSQSPVIQADPAPRDVKDKDDNKGKDNDRQRERLDKRDWSDERFERFRHHHHHHRDRFERWSAFVHRMERYNEQMDKIQIVGNLVNPVEVVRLAAPEIGFDVTNDTFTLLSQSGTQSIVTVIHNGNSYNVTVDQLANGNWRVSVVNPL